MPAVRCPDCTQLLVLDASYTQDRRFRCPYCHTGLKVVSTSPLDITYIDDDDALWEEAHRD